MAFAFQSIDDLLNQQNGGQQSQSQSNIFGGGQGQGGTQQASAVGMDQSNKPKTVDEGGGGSGGDGARASGTTAAPQDNTADKAAFAANAGKTATPAAFQGIQSSLGKAQSDLQNEANSYVSGESAKQTYGVSNADMDSAVNRDAGASTKVTGLLGQKAVNTVGEWKPTTNVNVSDVGSLNTPAGLTNLVSRGQDAGYTPGMAAFDVKSLRRNPEFQKTIDLLNNQQNSLLTQSRDLPGSKKAEIEALGLKNLQGAQAATKSYLGGKAKTLTDANDAQAAAANADLNANWANSAKQGIGLAAQNAVKGTVANADKYLPDVAGGIDWGKYATKAQDFTGDDFISGDDASQFNQIHGLLGDGGTAWTASGPTHGYYTANQIDANNALTGALTGKRNAGDQTEIDDILAKANATAEVENQRYGGLLADDPVAGAKWAGDQAAGVKDDFVHHVQPTLGIDMNSPGFFDDVTADPTGGDFYGNGGDLPGRTLSGNDVLTPEQVTRLNALAGEIGSGQTYTPGTAHLGENPNRQRTFNSDAYRGALQKALEAKIGRLKQQAVDTAPPPNLQTKGPGTAAVDTGEGGGESGGGTGTGGQDDPNLIQKLMRDGNNNLNRMTGFLGGLGTQGWQEVNNGINQAGGEFANIGNMLGGAAGRVAQPMMNGIESVAGPGAGDIDRSVGQAVGDAGNAVSQGISGLGGGISSMFGGGGGGPSYGGYTHPLTPEEQAYYDSDDYKNLMAMIQGDPSNLPGGGG